jgi:hypothetical protein
MWGKMLLHHFWWSSPDTMIYVTIALYVLSYYIDGLHSREGSTEAYVRVAATGLAVRIACRPSKGFSHGRG